MVIEVRPSIVTDGEKIGDRSRQQIFLSKDALLLYYAKYYTYTDSYDRRGSAFSRTFVRVPYSAECRASGKTIIFTGDLRKTKLDPTFRADEMTPEEAEINGIEATLTFMSPAKRVNTEKLLGTIDPDMISQITRAFELKKVDIEESKELSTWRMLLDRYLTEKKENLDTADSTIQSYWFADFLARRRQTKLGVKISQIFIPKGDTGNFRTFHLKRGRCKRTDVHTQGEMIYKYETANDKLTFSTDLPPIFSIVSTDQTPESRICPNCGSEVNSKEALEGCPSCGTRFHVTDYDFKVCGESVFHTKMKNGRLLVGTFFGTMLGGMIIGMIMNPSADLLTLFLNSIPIAFALGFPIYAVIVIGMAIVILNRMSKDSRVPTFCHRLRKEDPNLSAEEFEAEVLSRIRTFFLSDETDDIRFVSGAKPGQFQDIVDVRVKEYKNLAVVPNPDFQIVRAHVILELIRVRNGKFIRENGKYAFDIYRLATTKTELKTDKEIYTCPSCASSLSILDGGRCKFCGNTTDLSRYGWVLGAVQTE